MNGRCPFCPVDRLMADANQNQVFRWEERNTLTWRIYDNSDSLMRWTDGSLVHLQQSVDITDSLRLHKEANYDELTGLLNRRAGKAALADALVRLDREESSLIVGMFDLDRLKEVNDVYGHGEGDRALRTIAQEMAAELARAGHVLPAQRGRVRRPVPQYQPPRRGRAGGGRAGTAEGTAGNSLASPIRWSLVSAVSR